MTRSIPDRFSAVLMLGIALDLAILIPSLGQALAARLLRTAYKTSRIGFGPQLLAWLERAGTTWQVNTLPFWVYLGVETEKQHVHSPLKRAFLAASWLITSLLLALGVLAALAVAGSVLAGSARIHDVERDNTRIMGLALAAERRAQLQASVNRNDRAQYYQLPAADSVDCKNPFDGRHPLRCGKKDSPRSLWFRKIIGTS